jgi:hypothetical protein
MAKDIVAEIRDKAGVTHYRAQLFWDAWVDRLDVDALVEELHAEDVHEEQKEDGSLEHTLQEIADLTGATFEQVDKWAKTIDEDRFVFEPLEELANEFADQQ